MKINRKVLKTFLTLVADEKMRPRPALCGVHVEPQNGLIVATDGWVLGVLSNVEMDGSMTGVEPFTIPMSALKLATTGKASDLKNGLAIVTENGFGSMAVSITNAKYGDVVPTIPFGKIGDDYPNWRAVYPPMVSLESAYLPSARMVDIEKIYDALDVRIPDVVWLQNGQDRPTVFMGAMNDASKPFLSGLLMPRVGPARTMASFPQSLLKVVPQIMVDTEELEEVAV